MDLIALFLFTQENNEIKSLTKIYDFTIILSAYFINKIIVTIFSGILNSKVFIHKTNTGIII